MSHARRREFILLLGGAVARPFTAHTQQGGHSGPPTS
jgi:hypothetical protein